MIHTSEFASPRPIDVPLLLSAFGPKGKEIARELRAFAEAVHD